jgi:hypothetical protein
MAGKTKKATKSKSAGMVAPPLVAKREKLDLHIRMKPEQIAKLDVTVDRVRSAAFGVQRVASEMIAALANPQKLQHQRVQIVILDSTGAQVAKATHELKADETLSATVSNGFIGVSSRRDGISVAE